MRPAFPPAQARQGFSREQEFQADTLGVRYLTRAGYSPDAMASFLRKLRAKSQLDAILAGRSTDSVDGFNIMQTHPRTLDRIEAATRAAGVRSVRDPIIARDVYLDKIDGLVYGDSAHQGFVREREFLHPEQRFAFEVPKGFTLENGTSQVRAFGPNGAQIIFDGAHVDPAVSTRDYLVYDWAEGVRLRELEEIEVDGLETATAALRLTNQGRPVNLQLVAIRFSRDQIYRFLFVSPDGRAQELSKPFRRATYSFRKLSRRQAARLEPYEIKVITLRKGDTLSRLARRLPYEDQRVKRLAVLNGLEEDAILDPGQRLKIITDGR